MSVCVAPPIALSPPPAVQIGATLRFPLTMHLSVGNFLRTTSSHPHLVVYVATSVRDGVVFVLEALGTGSHSFTLVFEGVLTGPARCKRALFISYVYVIYSIF